MPIGIGTKPLTELKKAGPSLPKATVTTDLSNLNGKDGIQVTLFFPLPEDDEVEVTERMGRNTLKDDPDNPGQKIGQDNSGKIASVLKVIGRAGKVDLIYNAPNDPADPSKGSTEVALTDNEGNQIKLNAVAFIRVKGEVAEDDETED